MLEIGSVVDKKYKVLRKIGQGGMSTVYLVLNERANKYWAMKAICREDIRDDEVVRQGIIAEINILKRLKHPNLPSIIDVIDWQSSLLIVMDYIEGQSLDEILHKKGSISEQEVRQIAYQLCDVLIYLHSQKIPIIYRDMKPSNIMIKPDGHIVLIDFGAAREFKGNKLEDTMCLGTVGYAAPEQFGSMSETDVRTDIYGLGATLYQLLTGRNPAYKIDSIRHWNPSVSRQLEKIILKCTETMPERRYQTVDELRHDLGCCQNRGLFQLALFYMKQFFINYHGKYKFLLYILPLILVIGIIVGYDNAFDIGISLNDERQYQAYLAQAEITHDLSEKISLYIEAIHFNSKDITAYLGLIAAYLEDGNFEYSVLNTTDELYETEGKHIDMLLSHFDGNQYDLAMLYYKVGIAVYYYADGVGNKQAAYKYFSHVIGENGQVYLNLSDSLAKQSIQRAKCLKQISGYYAKLYMRDKSGDNLVSFKTYWEDLGKVIEGNIVAEDNYKTALVMYKESVTVMRDEIANFRDAGIEREDIEHRLDNIKQHLDNDFKAFFLEGQQHTEDIQQEILVQSERMNILIEEARRQIEIAYVK